MPALCLLGVLLSGCSTGGNACLQTPVSSKLEPKALAPCEEALTKHPGRRDIFLHTIEILRVQQRYREIVSWSQRALQHDSGRTEALFYLAYGLRKSGRFKEALRQYQAYAEAKPKDPDPYFGMALCWQELGQREQALSAYATYVEKEKRPGQSAWVERARAQMALLQSTAGVAAGGSVQGKVAHAAKPRRVGPKAVQRRAEPRKKRASARGCKQEEKTIRANPFDTTAYDRFAACAAAQGMHQAIVRRMRVGLRDNPDYQRGWLHLGRALQALGKTAQAKGALAKACAGGISEACGL